MGMARIGALHYESDMRSDEIRTISYLAEDTKHIIRSICKCDSIGQEVGWSIDGIHLYEFANISCVWKSLKAYNSLKAYKFL